MSANQTEETDQNLKRIAQNSANFTEFHEKTQKRDRLFREETRTDHFTKETSQHKNVNLKEIATKSITFSDFHEKAGEE